MKQGASSVGKPKTITPEQMDVAKQIAAEIKAGQVKCAINIAEFKSILNGIPSQRRCPKDCHHGATQMEEYPLIFC